MNVIILTPDRVGSTLLQRVLTIYMLKSGFDKPVINLHELTNGLEKYHNQLLNQEVLGKPSTRDYSQSLEQITELLDTANHYKTSRLAHYHIVNRKDDIGSQLKFYDYINKNFFIISCRRRNLFEHAISWAIQGHSKKLNVYHPFEKIDTFQEIYKNGITISEETIKKYLTQYKEYITWTENYFNVQSYFNYEDNVNDLESYILNLDFMRNRKNNTWKDMFDQDFNDWNTCHKLLPDVKLFENRAGGTNQQLTVSNFTLENHWNSVKGTDWPSFEDMGNEDIFNELPIAIQDDIQSYYNRKDLQLHYTASTSPEVYNYLNKNASLYKNTFLQISDMVDNGFLVTGVPIKLQTLMEKKLIIKNYSSCINWYNEWVDKNGIGQKYTEAELDAIGYAEERKLETPLLPTASTPKLEQSNH